MITVRELVTKLGFSVDKGKLQEYERGTDNIRKSAERAAISFGQMFAAFAGVSAIKSMVAIGDAMQSLEARLGMLEQSGGDAAGAFDHIAERASNANQSISAYGSFFVKAGEATKDFIKDQQTLTKVVDGAAFGLAASGAGAVEQEQAFFQLGQAIGSPIVQMEEMNTLIDVAPQLFRELGKVIPGANGNLKKFISTGAVTGEMLANGLAAVADTFETKMRKIPLTVGQAVTLVSNKWSAGIARLNRETNIITKIATTITDLMEFVGDKVSAAIDYLGGFENSLKLIGIVAASAFGLMIPGWIATAAATLAATWPILAIVAGLTLVGVLFDDFLTWLNGGDSALGDFIGSVENWRTELDNVRVVFDLISDVVGFLWKNGLKPLMSFSWSVFIGGLKIVASTFEAILSTVSSVVEGVRAIGNWAGFGGQVKAPVVAGADLMARSSTLSQSQVNNFNVTLPPGSPVATQEAARRGLELAIVDNPQFFSRQMAQAQ